MKHNSQEARQNPSRERQLSLRAKLLGGAALTLALVSGIVGGVRGFSHTRSSSNHNQAANVQVLSNAQLEQHYTAVGKAPIVAPDGKAEFMIGYDDAQPKEADLFVSTDKGSTWQEIAEDVGDGQGIDPTAVPAVWSPKTVNGQDVLAVLRMNTGGAPDADGNEFPEYTDLYAVAPDGAQKVGEAETGAQSLQVDYGGELGRQDMYYWTEHGDKVTFTTFQAVGGLNPDGSTWLGGMEAGSVTAQIPPMGQ